MKTSNKLLVAALLVFVASLTVYNMNLKAEYLTGAYKTPYHTFYKYNFEGFDEIQVNAANMIHLTIEQGDFKVMKYKHTTDTIKFSQVGKRLIVDIDYAVQPDTINTDEHFNEVVIHLPLLKYLKTNGYYLVNGKMSKAESFTSDRDHDNANDCPIEVRKFKLDSLQIDQVTAGIYLNKNNIKNLHVNAGKFSSAALYLDVHDTIQSANFNIDGFSKLILNNQTIPQLKYSIGPAAQITLNGAMLNATKH